ncbi:MAG TPA: GNAT family N-acetyltransferase [Phycisphaerales bacterium]|nr:GNAT family N-acetyltransferase [Phycisphaerales bacterium]
MSGARPIVEPVAVRPLFKEDAAAVAQLHMSGIQGGFITSLGDRFVTALYAAIARSPYGFGIVAECQGTIIGFVTFATDIKRLYRSVLARGGLRMAGSLVGQVFHISVIKGILQNLLYPHRMRTYNLPDAELLSVGVSIVRQRTGLATQLVTEGLRECVRRKVKRVKVLVAETNAAANRLYQKCGFALTCKTTSHGITSNVYVIEMPDAPC